ncbi:MAG TPA: trypsin-like peptidase domain-containing protein [Ktedonosporobacter sp.]|nr:trypsin-like peptidase domain-containing protein [Ktedonosporobacter sp.]
MSIDFQKSVVCLLDGEMATIGTGFVVSFDGLIATCAHVINTAGSSEIVYLMFQETGIVVEQRTLRTAHILPEYGRGENAEDVAMLRLDGPLPDGVRPLPLARSSSGTRGQSFFTFGFPKTRMRDGMLGECRVLGSVSADNLTLLQMSSPQVSRGFSGGPVWDEKREVVIGIVNSILQEKLARIGLVDVLGPPETAFATPIEVLLEACPLLQPPAVSPYQGLNAFTEAQSEFFFGRKHYIVTLLKKLEPKRDTRFLAVFGPSGSGKSSVVQAGLVTKLHQAAIEESDRWDTIVMQPGDDPFGQLARKMDGQIAEPPNLVESVKRWLFQHPQLTRLVLVIDQFEELFTVCAPAVRQDFINQFTQLPGMLLPVLIIVVMRDDFYKQFVEQTVLRQWLENSGGAVNVPQTLTRDEVTAIVQEPARVMGWRFEDGLVEIIVRDALETASSPIDEEQGPVARSTILPLLELALTELWEKCKEQPKILTHAAYEDIGGVAGCLTRRASMVFRELGDEEKQREARRLLTELVLLGDENQRPPDIRRRMPLSSLSHNARESEKMQQLIQQLADKKLLITTYDIERKQEMVEIIHDALLREWGQMRIWLQQDRRFLLWRQELERQARAWIESDVEHPIRRDKYKLYRGPDLDEASRWLQERPADLNPAEQEFIEASIQAQRRRLVVAIASGAALATSAAAGLTWWVTSNHTYEKIFIYTKHTQPVFCVAWSPDATRLASGGGDNKVFVYGSSGQDQYQHIDHTWTVTSLAWSPNGYWIASASADTTVHVWISALPPDPGKAALYKYVYKEHTQPVLAVTWSPDPDGQSIASGSMDQTIRGWQSGARIKELNPSVAGKDSYQVLKGHSDSVKAIAWSPDGKYLASGSGDQMVKIWDVSQLEEAFKTQKDALEEPAYTFREPSHVLGLAWSSDSKYLASAGFYTEVHIWSRQEEQQIFRYKGHKSNVTSVAWSPDNQYIASASEDQTVRVWKILTGETICVYTEHNARVNSVSWAPRHGDTRIASAGDDKKVRVWQLV